MQKRALFGTTKQRRKAEERVRLEHLKNILREDFSPKQPFLPGFEGIGEKRIRKKTKNHRRKIAGFSCQIMVLMVKYKCFYIYNLCDILLKPLVVK